MMHALAAYCAHEYRLRRPDKNGEPQRAHIEGLARQRVLMGDPAGAAKALAVLNGPELPDALEYLWDWFSELDRTRTYGMHEPDPLTYPVIEAWARLKDHAPSREEVDALLLLDAIARNPDAHKESA